MAGNAVVGKVSEHASWSAEYYGNIIQKALEAHGHNPDLVATVTGMAEAGQALCTSPLVDKIIFTYIALSVVNTLNDQQQTADSPPARCMMRLGWLSARSPPCYGA